MLDAKHHSILTLPPNVSRQDAVRAFRKLGIDALYWRAVRGRPQRIAAAYVPFRAYRVRYDHGHAHHNRYFALDRVEGILDLYEFPDAPRESNLLTLETRNCIPSHLPEPRGVALLREKVLRLIFQQGFFRAGLPNLHIERLPLDFHIPYWLAFYGTDGSLRCRVMDSICRRMEGGKAAALFEQWLAA